MTSTPTTSVPESIRPQVYEIVESIRRMGEPEEGQDGWYIVFEKKMDKLMGIIESYGNHRELEGQAIGMQKAKSRVLRRTEIPKDARNPTRDFVVILGEEIAGFIDDDIKTLESQKENTK